MSKIDGDLGSNIVDSSEGDQMESQKRRANVEEESNSYSEISELKKGKTNLAS